MIVIKTHKINVIVISRIRQKVEVIYGLETTNLGVRGSNPFGRAININDLEREI